MRLFADSRAATDGGTMAPSSMTANISGDLSSRRRSPSLRAICRCSSGVSLAMAPSISVTVLMVVRVAVGENGAIGGTEGKRGGTACGEQRGKSAEGGAKRRRRSAT